MARIASDADDSVLVCLDYVCAQLIGVNWGIRDAGHACQGLLSQLQCVGAYKVG